MHTHCAYLREVSFKHAKHMASMSEFTGSTHRWLEVAGRFAPAVAELKLNAGTVTELSEVLQRTPLCESFIVRPATIDVGSADVSAFGTRLLSRLCCQVIVQCDSAGSHGDATQIPCPAMSMLAHTESTIFRPMGYQEPFANAYDSGTRWWSS